MYSTGMVSRTPLASTYNSKAVSPLAFVFVASRTVNSNDSPASIVIGNDFEPKSHATPQHAFVPTIRAAVAVRLRKTTGTVRCTVSTGLFKELLSNTANSTVPDWYQYDTPAATINPTPASVNRRGTHFPLNALICHPPVSCSNLFSEPPPAGDTVIHCSRVLASGLSRIISDSPTERQTEFGRTAPGPQKKGLFAFELGLGVRFFQGPWPQGTHFGEGRFAKLSTSRLRTPEYEKYDSSTG